MNIVNISFNFAINKNPFILFAGDSSYFPASKYFLGKMNVILTLE